MRIEVLRHGVMVGLKIAVDKEEVFAFMPINIVGKLEAMLAKAKSHTSYKGSLDCIEGKWRVAESFDMNNP